MAVRWELSAGILLLLLRLGGATDHCLQDAIPVKNRLFVDVPGQRAGEPGSPVKVWTFNWASAELLANVLKIVASEALGYNVVLTGYGSASSTGIYAVAGCAAPTEHHIDAKCADVQVPGHHLTFEVWETAAADHVERLVREYPSRAPEKLGDLGYQGTETMYLSSSIRKTAYKSNGLPLEFYLSYDLAWHEPFTFFDDFRTIPIEQMRPCNDTLLMEVKDMNNYVKFTGDDDGVEVGATGQLQAKCWSGRWWLAPTCRYRPEKCVHVVTGGNGWFIYAFMQVAARYNMPLAIGTAATWSDYLGLPFQHDLLIYWWTPEDSFAEQAPMQIVFPEFDDQEQWNAGDKTSVASRTALTKWGQPGLNLIAPNVYWLSQHLKLPMSHITDMMLKYKVSSDSNAIACDWVRNNTAVWKEWLPSVTSCTHGQGLVDEDRRYVFSREEAVGCAPCDIGLISQPLQDQLVNAITFTCSPCLAGTSQQRYGDVSCTSCAPGTYGNETGRSQCTKCSIGTYTPEIGANECIACEAPLTSAGVGSVSIHECVCPEGMYRARQKLAQDPFKTPNPHVCLPCPLGLTCSSGGSENNVPCIGEQQTEDFGRLWPRPQVQYYVSCKDPSSPFKCLHAKACPGGGIEVCGTGFHGLVCSLCDDGLYRARRGSECRPCMSSSEAFGVSMLLVMAPPLVVLGLHKIAAVSMDLNPTLVDMISSSLFLLLVFCQVLAKMLACDIVLPDSVLPWSEAMTYSLDLLKLFQWDCLAKVSFGTKFVLKMLIPIEVLLVFVLCYAFARAASILPGGQRADLSVAVNNYASLTVTFFIGIVQRTVDVFQCYQHPNKLFSMLSAPHIICSSPVWQQMALASVLAMLLFGIGAIGSMTYAVIVSPRRVSSRAFRTQWRFLLVRFRPGMLWWALVLLFRGIWLALAQVVSTQGIYQLFWVLLVLLGYLVMVIVYLPWKLISLNVVDVTMNVALIALCAPLFGSLSQETDISGNQNDSVVDLMRVLTALACIGAAIVILIELCSSFFRGTMNEPAHDAKALSDFFLRLDDPRFLEEALSALSVPDLDSVARAQKLLQREVLKLQPGFRPMPATGVTSDIGRFLSATPYIRRFLISTQTRIGTVIPIHQPVPFTDLRPAQGVVPAQSYGAWCA